jgi:hypothetical protein
MNHNDGERLGDMPAPIRWVMVFIKNVGFPIVVCVWLAYQQFIDGKDQRKAINDFRDVLISLKGSIDQQNRILRHKNANANNDE